MYSWRPIAVRDDAALDEVVRARLEVAHVSGIDDVVVVVLVKQRCPCRLAVAPAGACQRRPVPRCVCCFEGERGLHGEYRRAVAVAEAVCQESSQRILHNEGWAQVSLPCCHGSAQ